MIWYHNGDEDFPHGAGASDAGYYVYEDEAMQTEPDGPFATIQEALKHDNDLMTQRAEGREGTQ